MNGAVQDTGADTGRRGMYVFTVAFIASIGGFLFGFDLSIMGAANIYLREQWNLTPGQFGFTTASAAVGCIFGPFLGAWICDVIGRKKTMIAAALLLAASAVVTATARDLVTFNAFRIVGGLGVGLCSIASPMYIAEVSPAVRRGGLGVMYQLAIVVGAFFAPMIAYFLAKYLPDHLAWRWMFASEMGAILAFAAMVFILPSSPRWLASRGRHDEALAVLTRVGGPEHAARDLDEIEESLKEETGRLADLLQPGIRYALLIGFLLAFFNNWTGWSVIHGYVAHLLVLSGIASRSLAILQYAITYGFMGVLTLVSLLLMDRVGRRPLWLVASALMAVITALTGMVFHFQLSGFIVLVVIILCTVPHGIALGGVPWLMMSEIFPTRLRAKAVAVTTTFLWVTIYSGSQFFPLLNTVSEKAVGSIGGTFWLLTVVCIFAFLFGLFMLPETKGKTLEEIAQLWRRTSDADA